MRFAQSPLAARRAALRLPLRGALPSAHGDKGSKPRYDLVRDHRQGLAKHRARLSAMAEAREFRSGWQTAEQAQSALAKILTASARTPALKKKDNTPCASVKRRMLRDVTCTSDTWHVMPTTNE